MGRDERWSTIAVGDSGPVIAEEDLPHVFERFYRSQRSRDRGSGGVGLGLSIVKAIVTAHGGDITAAIRPRGWRCSRCACRRSSFCRAASPSRSTSLTSAFPSAFPVPRAPGG